MASSTNTSHVYTIEQIELIRRLRNSGLTKAQLVQAFESLERLDRELGPTYNVPVQNNFGGLNMGPGLTLPQGLTNGFNINTSSPTPLSQTKPSSTSPLNLKNTFNAINPWGSDLSLDNGDLSSDPLNCAMPPMTPGSLTVDDILDDSEEMKELLRKDDKTVQEEISSFIMRYNIKQHLIASISGLSQAYVSRFYRGETGDMSERSKKAIYRCYLILKKNPGAAVLAANSVAPLGLKRLVPDSPDYMGQKPDYLYGPKRERFVFRPTHLEILEKCYSDDNYPSAERREEIARECNLACPVSGREVTQQIISNWFANKRKDMKRLAKEEGMDVTLMGFRGKGRPGTCITSSVSHSPEQNSNQSHEDGNQSQDETSKDDQSLSLAVEVAAVNQAILSLSGKSAADSAKYGVKIEDQDNISED